MQLLDYSQLFIRNLISRRAAHFIRRRYICLVLTLVLVVSLYVHINKAVEGSYTWRSTGRRCMNTNEENEELTYLIKTSHEILDKLNIPHFLCYGSLWGALRYKKPLPWDYDYDMGILYEDMLKIDEKALFEEFNKKDIYIAYHNYAGNYKVEKGHMTGDLMIFRDYYNNGIMRRTGFESWMFFVHYRYYHQFPNTLIKKPLPTMEFAGENFFVPRGGIEIQKHHYPNNWWKEMAPIGCNSTKGVRREKRMVDEATELPRTSEGDNTAILSPESKSKSNQGQKNLKSEHAENSTVNLNASDSR